MVYLPPFCSSKNKILPLAVEPSNSIMLMAYTFSDLFIQRNHYGDTIGTRRSVSSIEVIIIKDYMRVLPAGTKRSVLLMEVSRK